jgi:hypothetical protein
LDVVFLGRNYGRGTEREKTNPAVAGRLAGWLSVILQGVFGQTDEFLGKRAFLGKACAGAWGFKSQ